MKINQKLKDRRKEIGLTMYEVAQRVGVSEATVSRWESGDIANMRRDKIVLLATALNVSPSFIMGWEDEEPTPSKNNLDSFTPNITEEYTTFPVIGEVAAGFEHIAVEDWEGDKIDIPTDWLCGRPETDFFVLRIKGDSMYPEYKEGDKLLVLKQPTMDYSGQIGVVIYDTENATVKKVEYKQGEDWLRLVPINPNYPQKRIENADLEQCHILGIPRILIRDIKD